MRGGSTIWQPAAACLCISKRNCRSSLLKWLIVSAAETFWSPLGCNNAHSFKNKAQNDTQHCECKQLFFSVSRSHLTFSLRCQTSTSLMLSLTIYVTLWLSHFYELVECVALPAADWGPVNTHCCPLPHPAPIVPTQLHGGSYHLPRLLLVAAFVKIQYCTPRNIIHI